jgi:hypothetical protein
VKGGLECNRDGVTRRAKVGKYLNKLVFLVFKTSKTLIAFSKGRLRVDGAYITDNTVSEGSGSRPIIRAGI